MNRTATHVEDVLLDFAYGELPAEQTREVEAHLSSCAHCQAQLDDIQGVRKVMSKLPESAAPSAGLDSLMAYAEQAARRAQVGPPPKPTWWRKFFLPVLLGSAAVVAFFTVADQAYEGRSLDQDVARAAEAKAGAEAADSARAKEKSKLEAFAGLEAPPPPAPEPAMAMEPIAQGAFAESLEEGDDEKAANSLSLRTAPRPKLQPEKKALTKDVAPEFGGRAGGSSKGAGLLGASGGGSGKGSAAAAPPIVVQAKPAPGMKREDSSVDSLDDTFVEASAPAEAKAAEQGPVQDPAPAQAPAAVTAVAAPMAPAAERREQAPRQKRRATTRDVDDAPSRSMEGAEELERATVAKGDAADAEAQRRRPRDQDARALLDLARARRDAGSNSEAVSYARQALSIEVADVRLRQEALSLLCDVEPNPAQANRWCERLVREYPQSGAAQVAKRRMSERSRAKDARPAAADEVAH